ATGDASGTRAAIGRLHGGGSDGQHAKRRLDESTPAAGVFALYGGRSHGADVGGAGAWRPDAAAERGTGAGGADRQGDSGEPADHAGGNRGAGGQAAEIQYGAVYVFRRARAGAGGDRDFRRAVVQCCAADTRDRRAHGVGGGSQPRAWADDGDGRKTESGRSGRGAGGESSGGAGVAKRG